MSVFTIHTDNFETAVLRSEKPGLVDFWAPWCGPCKMIAPAVEKLAEEHPELAVGKINVDEQPELAQRYQVMSIPTLMLFKDGAPVAVSVGLKSKSALEAMVR